MYKMLSDNPRTEDLFGFDPMAKILADVIDNTDPPFTIGIFGEWGSGKTTLMNLVEQKLDADSCKTVWFNAWKYDGKEVVWNALIQSIFLKMREDMKDEIGRSDFIDRLSAAASNLAVFAARKTASAISGGVVDAETFDAVTKALRPLSAASEQFKFINEFEETFRGLVTDYVGPNGRLVIFVDDLDRCLPETAVQVMEAIKLYLDSANVTFVIGVEPEVVRAGIRFRYKENEALADKEYLEKIVQLPFYMRTLDRSAALSLLQPYAKTIEYSDDPMIVDMLLHATESNPRRIKRFINTFYVLGEMRMLANGHLSQEDRRRLALVLLTQMHFRSFYERLEKDPRIVATWHAVNNMGSTDRRSRIDNSEDLKDIDADNRLREFLNKAEGLECDKLKMQEWVLLTRGE